MGFTQSWAKNVANYDDPQSRSHRFRARRVAPLIRMVEDVHRDKGAVRIADIGGTVGYWNILPPAFLRQNGVQITLINLGDTGGQQARDGFTFVEGDGCDLAHHASGSFDIVHSNSVIEHVGDWDRMARFAGEVRRIAKRYFVQTPNFWFPIEPHAMTPLFHWLPRPLRISLVQRFALGNWEQYVGVDAAVRAVDSARLLDRKMFSALFPDAEIQSEKFGPLVKSFVAVRN